jgi:hypothetical protein
MSSLYRIFAQWFQMQQFSKKNGYVFVFGKFFRSLEAFFGLFRDFPMKSLDTKSSALIAASPPAGQRTPKSGNDTKCTLSPLVTRRHICAAYTALENL